METLAADRDEVSTDTERRWVATMRRRYGIKPNEGTCWFVEVEQEYLESGTVDHDTKWLSQSPGDALSYAASIASYARSQQGTGRWILETFEDGVNGPTILKVRPHLDEQYD